MPNKLDVMTSMASLDAIDADGISISGVASLAPVEVMHGERCVTRYLVQALSIGHRLLDSILVVEYLVASNNGLHATGQAQAAKAVVEDLIELQGSSGVVGDLNTSSQAIENSVPPEYWVTLCGYQHTGLSIPEYVIFFQDAL